MATTKDKEIKPVKAKGKSKKPKAPGFLEAMIGVGGGEHDLVPRTGVGSLRGGAPIKLNKALIEAGYAYIDLCNDSPMVVRKMFGVGVALKVNIPSIEGLSLHLGVPRKDLYNWEQKATEPEGTYPPAEAELYKGILHILDNVRAKQAARLINGGLSGLYNHTITKLMLGKHGYAEQSESKNTHEHSFSLTGLYEAAKQKREQGQLPAPQK